MDEARIPPALQRFYITTTQNPQSGFARKAFGQYLETLAPQERARIEGMLKRAQQPAE